ncbi:CDP-glycerol glycerophosphotransferase family protein [Globicatella sulfidifaciens]|uniref:CDP-ribitol ribitolphosphotransferase n=1 Tax=Globicatella sulfidifaciens TaxID=136093 RepID=A0A7X8H145_9LACT|nr:CDP-glycerol glycerophosphotransferase family protein [Globicatella sulfidifaciens]NLJ19257.1 hypothetical protein [Globicatella sulfidifaciens]
MSRIKLLRTFILKLCISSFYKISSLLPINKGQVVFASSRSDELQDNLHYVYNEFKNRKKNYKYIFLLSKHRRGVIYNLFNLLRMLKATYYLATSEFFFVDDYYYPIYNITPREGVKIIQLWHAAGAFKKFGYSTIGKDFGASDQYLKLIKVHSNYTYAIVSGKSVIPMYAEAFNMDESKILPLGTPRVDFFYQYEKHQKIINDFYFKYPQLKRKKIILYAPTYRGGSYNQSTFKSNLDFHYLYEQIGEEYVIITHLHPYITGGLSDSYPTEFVIEMDRSFNINELMIISDLLITDYSSVIFEFSLLKKPIIFYTPDIEEYKKERDFYFDFEKFIPGESFKDSKSLAHYIKRGRFNIDEVMNFSNKFFTNKNGLNSKSVVDYFISISETNSGKDRQ